MKSITKLLCKSSTSIISPSKKFSTVAERCIRLTFVDQDGNRATVQALPGQSVLDVALQNKIDIEGACEGGGGAIETRRTSTWVETTYGEGPNCFACHVQIPKMYHHLLENPTGEEVDGLKNFWQEDYHSTSRLACQIKLEKKHDGMVIFVPDAPPLDIM